MYKWLLLSVILSVICHKSDALNGAILLGIDKHTGTIVAGEKADFMILQGDPSKDINNTRQIIEVWKNGKKAE